MSGIDYVGTVIIVSPNCYFHNSFKTYQWYRHPTFNYNPLLPMIKGYNSLLEDYQVLAKEDPILVIETFREIIQLLQGKHFTKCSKIIQK